MNITFPRRKPVIALLCGIVAVSLLYQLVKGWNTAEFLLRVLGSTAVACVIWRSGALVAQAYGGGGRSFALRALLWAAVAALAVLYLAVGIGA